MSDETKPPGRLNWPSFVVVVSAVGLTLLHSWLLVTALWGGPLRNLDVVLTAAGKLLLWSMWLFTVMLALQLLSLRWFFCASLIYHRRKRIN